MEQYEFNPSANMTTLPHVSDAERQLAAAIHAITVRIRERKGLTV